MILAAGDLVIASGINLVSLSIAVGVANALLLPIILGFVYRLACTELPERHRLNGGYAVIVGLVFLITARFGFYPGSSVYWDDRYL